MKQFVPLTDDMLYQAGGPPALLVPYHYGIACCHRACEASDYTIDKIKANDVDRFSDAPLTCRPD
ncbi:MAG: hypothetical protein ABI304_02835 [Rudaea sp.]